MIKIAAIMFILAVVSSASAWLMGSDRNQAIAAVDGTGPRWFGYFSNKFGTPLSVNLVSGIISTIIFIGAAKIGEGDASKAFNVTIGVVLIFTTLSYILIFPAVIKLRYSHPHAPRPYKVPGGIAGVWIAGLLTTFFAVLASIAGIFPGIFTNGLVLDDTALPEGVSRSYYTTLALGAVLITAIVGLWFYWLGRKTRGNLVIDPEIPTEFADGYSINS
jgi:amino acid transporter